MVCFDKVKNIFGFVEMFVKNLWLREFVNFVVVVGNIQKEKLKDCEEMVEIDKMYNFMKEYEFDGDF